MAELSHEIDYQAVGYRIGDCDRRPWGSWLVTDKEETVSGSGYCEKVIVVYPGKILSLQSHKFRQESWTVLEGTLLALVDGKPFILGIGQKLDIPIGAVHSMANLGETPCIVKERQTGICRESDIIRYFDANGRAVTGQGKNITASIKLYKKIVEKTEKGEKYG